VNYREKAEDLHEFIISNPCEACVETIERAFREAAAEALNLPFAIRGVWPDGRRGAEPLSGVGDAIKAGFVPDGVLNAPEAQRIREGGD
jgi:hypothetical protein